MSGYWATYCISTGTGWRHKGCRSRQKYVLHLSGIRDKSLLKYQLLIHDQNFLIRHCYLWLPWIKMMIPMLRAVAWLAAHDTHACVWENKDPWLEMARLSPFVPFGLSGLVIAFLTLHITWLFAKKDVICVQQSNCQHGLQESLRKLPYFIVWGEVPCQIS